MNDLAKKSEVEIVMDDSPEKEIYYPKLYLSDVSGIETPDVGSEGIAKIKYRIVSKNESERKSGEGVTETNSIDIDVMGIEFVSKEEKSSDEDEIEKGLSESEDEMEKSETEKED